MRSRTAHSPLARPIPGWVLGIALAYPSILTWGYFVALAEAPSGFQQGAFAAGKLIQFVLPLATILAVGGKIRTPAIGGSRIGEGAASGIAILVATVGTWRILHATGSPLLPGLAAEIQSKLEGLGVAMPWGYLGLALSYSCVHTLLEEYYWRWFVFGRLREIAALPVALAVGSLGFTAHHVILLGVYLGWSSPWTYLFSAAVAAGGAYWGWLYERSGSLVAPWISHMVVDVAIFGVGYLILS